MSRDPILMDNFMQDKDIYSTLASTAYKLPYEQCTKNTPEGKVRRNHGKVLLLALSYGMRAKSLAQSLGISVQEATAIYDGFVDELHVAFEYGDKVRRFCRANGYAKTIFGRKRRFPAYTLPEYEVRGEVPIDTKREIIRKIKRAYWTDRYNVIADLETRYSCSIIDNTKEINKGETEILNSVIQGSAALMTKLALIKVHTDKRLIELGAFPVLAIHDEIIMEVPKENADKAVKIMEECMLSAAKEMVEDVPFKAEGEILERWYKD